MSHSLEHIYWVGGSPCSGKSSVTDLLAARFDWRVYHCDLAFDDHLRRANPAQHPWLSKVPDIVWDDFWMRPISLQLRNAVEAYTEEFPMILHDLRALPDDRPVLVEGTALLPERVADVLADVRHGLWMVPASEFLYARYPARGEWVQAILSTCRQPDAALKNWMARDVATAVHVQREAELRNLPVLTVDGSRTIEDNAALIADYFTGNRCL